MNNATVLFFLQFDIIPRLKMKNKFRGSSAWTPHYFTILCRDSGFRYCQIRTNRASECPHGIYIKILFRPTTVA